MRLLISAMALVVAAPLMVSAFPTGKFDCSTASSKTYWEVSESADKLPLVTVTTYGTGGASERHGLADIVTVYDAAGKVVDQRMRLEQIIMSFDANGPKFCTRI